MEKIENLSVAGYLFNNNMIDVDLYLITHLLKYSFRKQRFPKMTCSLNVDCRVEGGKTTDNFIDMYISNLEWNRIIDFLIDNKIIEKEHIKLVEIFGLEITYKQLRKELSKPASHNNKNRYSIRKENELRINIFLQKLIRILQFLSDSVEMSDDLLKRVMNCE